MDNYTIEQKSKIMEDMFFLASLDPAEFAMIQPMAPSDKTQFRTKNSMVRKRVKTAREPLEIQMVDHQYDLQIALKKQNFWEALIPYLVLRSFLGGA